jgi:DNA-binding NtrC family response regulator
MSASTGEVLIVDGDPAIRRLLEVVVKTLPKRPVLATDGRSAISLLDNRAFDAVVLELILPEVSGAMVLEDMELHHPDQLRHTVIVTTTPESGWESCPQTRSVAAVLRKPFALDALQMALRKCCEDAS